MAELFFSSDLHLYHEAMFKTFTKECGACGEGDTCLKCGGSRRVPARAFTSIEEMHNTIWDGHNGVVKSTDHWWNLGDVTMLRGGVDRQLMMQIAVRFMNGHKRLILGNHDHFPMKVYSEVFEKIQGSHRIENLMFSHFPLHPSTIAKGCVNVHGHIHCNPAPPGPYINISVEAINYVPLSLGELKERAATLLRSIE